MTGAFDHLPTPGLPHWLQPSDGDELFGIDAIAAYLDLPFLDVRTMIELGRLPTWKASRSHVSRRSALAGHFAEIEARDVPDAQRAPMPANVAPDGALGLLSGQHAMAAYLSCSHSAVRHRRAQRGLAVFWLGKTPMARRASLDRWRTGFDVETRSIRRLASIHRGRCSVARPGALVGARAIADHLGTTPGAVFLAIYAGKLPAYRAGKGWAIDPADLAALPYKPRRRAA